jgi:hypothetical protein
VLQDEVFGTRDGNLWKTGLCAVTGSWFERIDSPSTFLVNPAGTFSRISSFRTEFRVFTFSGKDEQ